MRNEVRYEAGWGKAGKPGREIERRTFFPPFKLLLSMDHVLGTEARESGGHVKVNEKSSTFVGAEAEYLHLVNRDNGGMNEISRCSSHGLFARKKLRPCPACSY